MPAAAATLPVARQLRFVRRSAMLAGGVACVLVALSLPSGAQTPAAFGNRDLREIVVYAQAHRDSAGVYQGRPVKVTGTFSHVDHANDDAAKLRAGNARSFEIVITDHVVMPSGIGNIYVACLLPRDHPYARLADALPLGKEPDALENASFTLQGDIDGVVFETRPADAQLNLVLGCSVTKR